MIYKTSPGTDRVLKIPGVSLHFALDEEIVLFGEKNSMVCAQYTGALDAFRMLWPGFCLRHNKMHVWAKST